jgi:hypothetical protein
MLSATTTQRNALKNGPVKIVNVCEFKLGNTWHYLTDDDVESVHGLNTYLPGYLEDIDDIELSSTPKVEDSNITLDGTDSTYIGLFLSQTYMNQPLIITRLYKDAAGDLIMSKVVYKGFITDREIDDQNQYTVTGTVSSIWKDFEKQAGIKTNATSQKRYYPSDTGFEHSAKATKATPWGKEGDGRSVIGTTNYKTSKFDPPELP